MNSKRLHRAFYSLILSLALCPLASSADAAPPLQRITQGLPPLVQQSRHLGAVAADEVVALALVLPTRNQAQLNDLLHRLYDPNDPAYGQYLTSNQFTAQFGPTQADYDAVIAWAQAYGLRVTQTHPNRKIVDVSGPAAVVEQAFNVQLLRYQAPDGRVFRAPSNDPLVPASIAARLSSIIGLDTAMILKPGPIWPAAPLGHFNNFNPPLNNPGPPDLLLPDGGGHFNPPGGLLHNGGGLTGPDGGLSPTGIQTAYNLTTVSQSGTGQVLGLFELDGYTLSDITGYETTFDLPNVPLQNVLIDGFSGAPATTGGSGEVTLDIEMMVALAPGASKIIVYEAPNSDTSAVDTYNKIATDNLAKEVSTSWGVAENLALGVYQTENATFQQMAAQGQSLFAASGDDGAFANLPEVIAGQESQLYIIVQDPSSQPYVTGVGGTTLTVNANGTYSSETVWNTFAYSPPYLYGGASGGGISDLWSIPSWQSGVITAASMGSTTARNVPDVALDADPNTGYAYYFQGSWASIAGGTSAAAPLWAAFTALVNQARVADNCPVLGFANPTIYGLTTFDHASGAITGPNYTADFHDITQGMNGNAAIFGSNGYPAVTGYDDCTGWGTFNGANLLGDLVSLANTGTLTQLIGDPGFENKDVNIAPWVSAPDVIGNGPAEPAHSGTWDAWLCGYGYTHTDTLYQTVHIPALATAATLSFWLHIDSDEPGPQANDTLKVQLRNTSGNVLQTLATYSNLNKGAGYTQKTFSLPVATYAGQTIQIYLVGSENATLQTSFVVDDFSLAITE
jgi:kumamolisin